MVNEALNRFAINVRISTESWWTETAGLMIYGPAFSVHCARIVLQARVYAFVITANLVESTVRVKNTLHCNGKCGEKRPTIG